MARTDSRKPMTKKTLKKRRKRKTYSVVLEIFFDGNVAIEAASNKEAIQIAERIVGKHHSSGDDPIFDRVALNLKFDTPINKVDFKVRDVYVVGT